LVRAEKNKNAHYENEAILISKEVIVDPLSIKVEMRNDKHYKLNRSEY